LTGAGLKNKTAY